MFSTRVPGGEDHVTGSAHCLLAPFWYKKLGIGSGVEITAKQVSTRGGVLSVVYDSGKGKVRLRAGGVVFATGGLDLASR